MNLNIQLFGGRGANSPISKIKSSKTAATLNLPSGITKQQEEKITRLYNGVLQDVYGSTKDSYEIKEFNVDNNKYFSSVSVTLGMKNDDNTMGILTRRRAYFIIGKRGKLEHFSGKGGKKTTKTIFGAFYDYEYK